MEFIGSITNSNCFIKEDKITVKKTYLYLLQDALIESVKKSLMGLLARIVAPDAPLFEVDVMLISPDIVITPSMDDLENAILHAGNEVVASLHYVEMWDDVGPSFAAVLPCGVKIVISYIYLQAPDFLHLIEDHPDISDIRGDLADLLSKFRERVEAYLASFQKYNYVREQDLNTTFNKFISTNPTMQQFEEKLDEFQAVDKEIAAIDSFVQIGAISLCTDSLKYALKNEVSQWRSLYITNLRDKTKEKLQTIMDSTTESAKKMAIKINDVDDLRHGRRIFFYFLRSLLTESV